MIGRYRTVNDRVICVVQKAKDANGNNMNNNVSKYKRSSKAGRSLPYVFEVPDQVFHFELEIKGKKFKRLHWISYAVVSRYKSSGRKQEAHINVKDLDNYPPLYFSHVRSYGYSVAITPLK